MSKTPYSAEDERNLVEYIAAERPLPKNRLGNKLYQQLVENAGNRWPWSKRHSWMSWREHYKKNQDWFDHKIKKYQKSKRQETRARSNQEEEEEEEEHQNDASANKVTVKREPEELTTVPPKPASDARAQKVTATREEGAKTSSSSKRAKAGQNERTDKPAKLDASKSKSSSRSLGTKASSSKPSEPVLQQKQDGHSKTQDEQPDESLQQLSENEMIELFGSFVEDEDEEMHEEEIGAKGPNIYPNLQDAPSPVIDDPEPQLPGAFDVQPRMPKAKAPAQRPRPRLKQNKEDPFETPSDSSQNPPRESAAPRALVTKKLPVMEEGAFRTTFKRSRARVDEEGEEEEEARPWPPKRSKKERDAARQASEAATFTRPRQGVQVNAVASSSKTMLPPTISPDIPRTLGNDVSNRTLPTKRPGVGDTAESRFSTNVQQPVLSSAKHQGRTLTPVLKPAISKLNNEITTSTTRTRADHHHNPPAKSSSDVDPFTAKDPVSEKAAGKVRAADESYVIGDENESPEASRRIDLHKQTLLKRRRLTQDHSRASRRGSVLSSRGSLSSLSPKRDHSRRSNSLRKSISELDLPDEDTRDFLLAAAESTEDALQKMAEDYGFPIEDVEEAFKKTRSVRKTELFLKQLRRDLDQLQQEMVEKQKALFARINFIAGQDDGHDSDNDIPYGLVKRVSTAGKASGKSSRRSSPRKSRSKRQSLNIKPIISDEDDVVISDYSPPGSSRAGQFARLVRQGRKEEAIEREKRRVSGIFVPTTQHGGGRPRQSLLAREIPVTPTPHPRDSITAPMDIDDSPVAQDQNAMDQDDDDDDMYVHTDDEKVNVPPQRASPEHKHASGHEEEQEHEANDEFEPSQQTRQFRGQDHSPPDFEEDEEAEDAPAAAQSPPPPSPPAQEPADAHDRIKALVKEAQDKHPALALEYRILARNVSAENADEMRQFEARNDPDFLRLMSLQLIGELADKYRE